MTEQEFIQFFGNDVIITLKSGITFKGFCCSFTRAIDNDSNIPSLSIEAEDGLFEVMLDEVKEINKITP